MKRISIVFAALMLTGLMFAQEGKAPLSVGEKQMNFGLGFGNGLPVYWGMDWSVHDDITVGGVAALNVDNFDWLSLNAKGDYHFNRIIGIPSNWDFYGGLGLGYQIPLNDGNGGFDWDLHVGGRWYWSDKWGLNLELGGGNGFGTTIGVSMKM